MSRFLTPALAAVILAGVPAMAAESVPGIGRCVEVRETATTVGFQVCTPPVG